MLANNTTLLRTGSSTMKIWQNGRQLDYYQPTKQDHQWHATGRVGRPSDVAELVSFLADEDKSGFITCQEFVVDGGVSRKMVYPE